MIMIIIIVVGMKYEFIVKYEYFFSYSLYKYKADEL